MCIYIIIYIFIIIYIIYIRAITPPCPPKNAMPISNGRCSQGPKWAMQLWLDLRPLLGGVVVPTEINFLGILNVNAKKEAGICWEYTTVANPEKRHNVRIMTGPCLILFLTITSSIQHHPTQFPSPKKIWLRRHELMPCLPPTAWPSPSWPPWQPPAARSATPAAPPNAGDAGQMATRNGRNGSRRWWKWEQEWPSGRFRADFLGQFQEIARMDDWWYDIYVVILLVGRSVKCIVDGLCFGETLWTCWENWWLSYYLKIIYLI